MKNKKKPQKPKKTELMAMKDFAKILGRLDGTTRIMVGQFIQDEVTRLTDVIKKDEKVRYDNMIQALDRCLSAGLIQNTDFSFKDIEHILNDMAILMLEDTRKVAKLKKESKGEEWVMTINKFESEVRERAIQLIKEGAKQKEAIEKLAFEFPKLSKSMVTNAYKKVKEELEEEKQDQEQEEPPKKEKSKKENKKEEQKQEEKIEQEQEQQQTTSFNILKMDVEGAKGVYHIEGGVITHNGNSYESEDTIKANYSKKREEVLRVLGSLNEEEKELLALRNQFIK